MSDPTPTEPRRWTTLETEMHLWRQTHPEATLTELEAVIDAHWQVLRAELLGELAIDVPAAAERCPGCGGPLVTRGRHQRMVITQGDRAVAVTRSYQTCPACGHGSFPPR